MEEQKSLHNKRCVRPWGGGAGGAHYKILQKDIKKGLIYGVYHIHEHKYIIRIQFIFHEWKYKDSNSPQGKIKPIKIQTGFEQKAGKLIV